MKKTKMLKKNYEFKNVLTKGKYYSGRYIEAFIRDNNKNYNLLGLAISTKVGKAFKRNYIKRLLRESYKINEDVLKSGKSMVFLWKKNVDTCYANFGNIQTDMNLIFDKADLKIDNVD